MMQAGGAVINAVLWDNWDGCQEQLSIGMSDTLIGVGLVNPHILHPKPCTLHPEP